MLYYQLIITSLETISKEIDLSNVICELLPENIMLTDRLYDPIAPDNFQQCLSYFNGNLAQLDKTISSNYQLFRCLF